MKDGGGGGDMPAACPECGEPWELREVFWEEPSLEPVWGYLVFCRRRHWNWYRAEVGEDEAAVARARFARLQRECFGEIPPDAGEEGPGPAARPR